MDTSLEPEPGGSGKLCRSNIGWELTTRMMEKKELLTYVINIKLLNDFIRFLTNPSLKLWNLIIIMIIILIIIHLLCAKYFINFYLFNCSGYFSVISLFNK